jgi:cell division protein FtsZ
MDRRDFLQTFTARGVLTAIPSSLVGVGASPSLPAPVRQELTQTACFKDMEIPEYRPRIGVVTIGGMGFSIARHPAWPIPYLARTVAIDTDAEELRQSKALRQILLPKIPCPASGFSDSITLSANARTQIEQAVSGLDLVLLVVGLGGSTGTTVAPLVSKLLGQQQILTLVYAFLPFPFESEQRHRFAANASSALAAEADALITVENSDIHGIVDPYASIDAVSVQGANSFVALCRSIVNTVVRPDTLVSVDFDDLRHFILGAEGGCAFGHASAYGSTTAMDAARKAMDHSFLGRDRLRRASTALVSIEAKPRQLLLHDSRDIMFLVRSHLAPDANIFYSCVSHAPPDGSDFCVSILASGIPNI